MTVAHPVQNVDKNVIGAQDTFYVRFHRNPVHYRVQVLKYNFQGD